MILDINLVPPHAQTCVHDHYPTWKCAQVLVSPHAHTRVHEHPPTWKCAQVLACPHAHTRVHEHSPTWKCVQVLVSPHAHTSLQGISLHGSVHRHSFAHYVQHTWKTGKKNKQQPSQDTGLKWKDVVGITSDIVTFVLLNQEE